MLDCVLIVVSYRSAQDVTALLATVPPAVGKLSWRAVVVNNDPADDLSAVAALPGVEVVESEANLGYAGGINVGLAAAPPSRFTVFLNPDLRLMPDSIVTMARAAQERHAVAPRIVDDAGETAPSLRREPAILGSLGDALFGDRWPNRPGWLSEMIREPAAYERRMKVDWATGAALLVPTSVAREVGPWDADRFFLYSEETDYCRRLRAAGSQVRFTPDATVNHRGGGSGTSDALYALLEVNRVRYFWKWHRAPAGAAFAAVTALHSLLRASRSRNRLALRALLSASVRGELPGGTRQGL
ncbi:glycosyltransferase family 2 protein [Occultella kanbiaonis]|uniref:glycosyltransferase family 2 protein n=1 Tax=Occultella kanbiaonis TaxID=2675754 RepID=UPI0013D1ED31|nr:glycosyltransferase family 2 protein [Occultella kanbiaonis]